MSPLRCVLVAGLAWGLLQASLAPTLARDGLDGRTREVTARYMRTLSEIIHRRMRDNPYRTRSGGVATVTFDLDRSGIVSASAITRPSGSPYIDALAKAAVPPGYRFPPLPPELGLDHLNVNVPLRFEPLI